jgi:hypothetical protein
MDPRVLADWMKKGIENEQFLVVPYPSGPRMVELALRRFVDYASPEGMQRLAEKAKQPPRRRNSGSIPSAKATMWASVRP